MIRGRGRARAQPEPPSPWFLSSLSPSLMTPGAQLSPDGEVHAPPSPRVRSQWAASASCHVNEHDTSILDVQPQPTPSDGAEPPS